MGPRTICKQHCSIKPFTAVAVAGFVPTGQFSLDQPVAAFIPDFARRDKDRVTLRHVLTHTTGLRDRYAEEYAVAPARLLASICDTRLHPGWAPGARAAYSQLFGWQLLGRVVEVVSEAPFGSYLRSRVLAPLGLHDTWVGMPCEDYDRVHLRLGVSYVSRDTLPAHWDALGLPDPEVTEDGEPVGPLWVRARRADLRRGAPPFGRPRTVPRSRCVLRGAHGAWRVADCRDRAARGAGGVHVHPALTTGQLGRTGATAIAHAAVGERRGHHRRVRFPPETERQGRLSSTLSSGSSSPN